MNEKGRPGDFLSDGTFSQEKMPRYSPRSNRSLLAVTLLLLPSVTGLVAQNSAPVPSISLPGSQSPFTGSEPEGKATPEVLRIGFQEAIERGLRNNLGLLLSGDQTIMARGERWKELSNLLPNVTAKIQENVQTQSLTALGLKSNVFSISRSPGDRSLQLLRRASHTHSVCFQLQGSGKRTCRLREREIGAIHL